MTTGVPTIRNELAWLANCYVTGELSTEEAAAFEARLENDIAACDAVAQATELNLVVAAAFESQPIERRSATIRLSLLAVRPSRLTTSRTTGGLITALATAAIAAASLALMFGHRVTPANNELAQSTKSELLPKDRAQRLIAAWASGEADRNIAIDEDFDDLAHDSDLDPPDWMLAALTVDATQMQDSDNLGKN